jgi:ppGpp synthetase/RelA/SpoT-type nucleotidyltranferase
MDYLDQIDKMSLSELLDFVNFRNSYKEMMDSYEDLVAEEEFRYESEREERQLEYLEKEG